MVALSYRDWWVGITDEGVGWGAIGDAVDGLGLEINEDWWLLFLFIGDAVDGLGSLLHGMEHVAGEQLVWQLMDWVLK